MTPGCPASGLRQKSEQTKTMHFKKIGLSAHSLLLFWQRQRLLPNTWKGSHPCERTQSSKTGGCPAAACAFGFEMGWQLQRRSESEVAFNLELTEHASSVPISMWGFERSLINPLMLARNQCSN